MRCPFCGTFSKAESADTPVNCCADSLPQDVVVMSADRQSIFSVEEWFDSCPPKKGALQWKDGYSAKESAKAWFRGGRPRVPQELLALFRSVPQFAPFAVATVHPEVETPLDDFRGGRNADALLLGVADGKRALVSIEAKAGEDFGPLIGPYLKRVIGGTNVPERVDLLSGAVFGRPVVCYDPKVVVLRYQLLHALAGTAIEAHKRRAEQAAMVVHYFPNERRPLRESLADFQAFVGEASRGAVREVQPGTLVPLTLPGGGFVPPGATVWVGWATAAVPQ